MIARLAGRQHGRVARWQLRDAGLGGDAIRHRLEARRLRITVHRTDDLPPADVRTRDGIPVTTPTRTLLDLAATSPTDFDQALDEALLKRLIHPTTLLTRAVQRPGARAIRAALDQGPTPTRSEAERRLLTLVHRAGLPRPQTDVRIGRFEVDAVWRAQRVIVEVDGYASHSGRAAFETDRRRETVIAELAALLAAARVAA